MAFWTWTENEEKMGIHFSLLDTKEKKKKEKEKSEEASMDFMPNFPFQLTPLNKINLYKVWKYQVTSLLL